MPEEMRETTAEPSPRDYPSFGAMWADKDGIQVPDEFQEDNQPTFPEFRIAGEEAVRSVIEQTVSIRKEAEIEAERADSLMPKDKALNKKIANMLYIVDTTAAILNDVAPRADGASWKYFIEDRARALRADQESS